jgi:hypothetical protein
MCRYLRGEEGFFTLIGIILAVAITLFLCYLVLNTYFKPTGVDKSTQDMLSNYGIDASGSIGAYNSAKVKIKDIKKELNRRGVQIKNIR